MIFLLAITATTRLKAAGSPISLAIFPLFQFPPRSYSVGGLRLSLLWAVHEDMYGIDLGGIGNDTRKNFVGSSFSGLFNATHESTIIGTQFTLGMNYNKKRSSVAGLQIAGFMNVSRDQFGLLGVQLAGISNINLRKINIYGFQVALLGLNMNYVTQGGKLVGVQLAPLGNITNNGRVYGLQIGAINFAHVAGGFQIGIFNKAEYTYGFQIGLVNFTRHMFGIQIGLINIIREHKVPFIPILNIGY